jgi:hypothetical protein
VLGGEHGARAAEPGLDLVSDEENAVLPGEGRQRFHIGTRRRHEPPFAELELHHDRRDRLGIHRGSEEPLEVGSVGGAAALDRAVRSVVPVTVGIGDPVDLRRERAESLLVRHHLRGECHRQVGSAAEPVFETDDRRPPGEGPRDLHGILDRLGAGVDQEGALVVGARRNAVEPLGQLDIWLIGRDGETHMGEAVELSPDGLDHTGMAVAGVDYADSAAEID